MSTGTAALRAVSAALARRAVGRRYGVSDNGVRKWVWWYESEMGRAGRADGMKRLSCAAVVPGCNATFEAPDEEGILRQVVVHAREAHGMDEVPPALADEVVARMEEVSEAAPPGRAA
jgi:predicted small metal-binding protein